MLGTSGRQGYSITAHKEDADVIVVNTCGFIDSAKKGIHRYHSGNGRTERRTATARNSSWQAALRNAIADEIQKEIPEIDFIFGPDELGRILEAVQLDSLIRLRDVSIDALYTSQRSSDNSSNSHDAVVHGLPENFGRLRSRLHVLRNSRVSGPFSKPPDYRSGLTNRDAWQNKAFGNWSSFRRTRWPTARISACRTESRRCLRELAKVDGLKWVRFLYCYPNMVSDELVRLVAEEERLCKYFDIPYQHASRPMLERMKRGGNRDIYERQMESIRKLMPDAGLRTSFIVGFPGETEDDFQRNCSRSSKNVSSTMSASFCIPMKKGPARSILTARCRAVDRVRRRNQSDEGTVEDFTRPTCGG